MLFNINAPVSGGGGGSDPYPVRNDGKTHLWVNVAGNNCKVTIRCKASVSQGVTIEWGDGSSEFAPTGNQNSTHTYATAGKYEIVLTTNNGTLTLGYNTSICVMGSNASGSTTPNTNDTNNAQLYFAEVDGAALLASYVFAYCNGLEYVHVHDGIANLPLAFCRRCYSLRKVRLPANISVPNNMAFYYCYALKEANIGTTTGERAFYNCLLLSNVVIADSATEIGKSQFSYCTSLRTITIPAGVVTINNMAFAYCYGLKEIHFKPTIPPTVGSDAWTSLPTDCVIYVPTGTLTDYQAAENYPDPATHTYVEE